MNTEQVYPKFEGPVADVGVVVGRFQTPYLTGAHQMLLDTVTGRHAKLVVVLGVSHLLGEEHDPLDFATRKAMILESYPEAIVLPLRDHRSDVVWSRNLDNLLRQIFLVESIVLYGGRDSFIPRYSGKLTTIKIEEIQGKSGTELRSEVSHKPLVTSHFRRGVIYGVTNQYPKRVPCIDVAIWRKRDGELSFLFGQKEGVSQWQFIGGHIEGKYTAEMTVRKEASEEANVDLIEVKFLESFLVDDWRYKGSKNQILTLFFLAQYVSGTGAPGDDIAKTTWVKYSHVKDPAFQFVIIPEHLPLVQSLKYHVDHGAIV